MADSFHFMTVNGNLCVKRFTALPSLSCHGATHHLMLAPRGVLWCVTALGKTKLVLILCLLSLQICRSLHAGLRAGIKQHKFKSQPC